MRLILMSIAILAMLFCRGQAAHNDIIIGEIMADPSPVALINNGLPEVEYVELKNVSGRTINLNGFKLSDATATATINVNFNLLPDSFVVICSMGSAAALSAFGATIGVPNFPSLDNDGEVLSLRSKEGKLIFAFQYDKSWYRNPVKSEGGWSLEMIDTKNPCTGTNNWMASKHLQGGTPGKKNSVDAVNKDELPPLALRAYATDSLNVTIVFDEQVDSMQASLPANYLFSDQIGVPLFVSVTPPLFNSISIRLKAALQRERVYTLASKNIIDCSGNSIASGSPLKVGLAFNADTSDIIINEILFNPNPDGVDYVEVYNRSLKVIDGKDLYITSRASNGSLNTPKQLSALPFPIFPGDYLVITENAKIVRQHYVTKNPGAFLEISMPSLPDDQGDLVLMSRTGKIIDELAYSEKWHFKLIDNREGVALERINYNRPTQDQQNWHSGSTDAGYGTPTFRNSQFAADQAVAGVINVSPSTFSPDNDGFDDFVTITYEFPQPGYVCNITLYDAGGRAVRFLCTNALCGPAGYFRWDGLDEKGTKLKIGVYIMITEVFNLSGKVKKFKNAVVLARKLF